MITIEKHKNGLFYIRMFSIESEDFQDVLAIYASHNIRFVDSEKASYHRNPKVLLECLDELSSTYDTFISDTSRKEIELFDPYVPSFKPRRKRIDSIWFEKYKPLGKFQIDDVTKMFSLTRCLNANKQGLGKTYESVQVINQLFSSNEIDRVLIVAISSVLYNWKRELLAFSNLFIPEDILIVGKDQRNIFDDPSKTPKVLIMTYGTIKLVSDHCYKQKNKIKNENKKTAEQIKNHNKNLSLKCKNYTSSQIPFDLWGSSRLIILDEAHRIKNIDTQWTKILHYHKNFFNFRFELTGTPHPNHVGELYSLIKFLDENLVDASYNDFLKTIAKVGTKFSPYALDYIIEEKANVFLERIKPYVIRRFLRDHLDLPSIYEKDIYLELTGKQKSIYQQLVNESLIKIKQEKGKFTYHDIQTKFPFVLQILSDPCLLKEKIISRDSDLQETINEWNFKSSIKFEACENLLSDIFEDNKNSKVVVWSEHPKTIESLAESFTDYGVVVVHGSSTPKGWAIDKWRDHVVNDLFKNDSSKRLLIANPATIGTGTNMQYIQSVIIYDEGFSFVDKDQKKSRFERQGMVGSVIYYKLIVDNSIEVYQNSVMKNKEIQDKLALKEGLTVDELKNIFNGKS